jgi:hypothetical protein
MAQPTVHIFLPSGTTAIPCLATGTAFPSPGHVLVGMAYQINNGPVNQFGTFIPSGGSWSFPLTTVDCPIVGANYLLTVYAGENSAEFGTDSVNFIRTS